ncbi:MarR family transcriptional regulator [Subtercola sp. Z020]|uniref:MarR family winged helix-turn-helix transcriptional regulator n=1 Tax=Subtercola sp. Z020 TaxID=2080582 RepID=UPI000CE803BB|nr:MarR family transcriptional regulator [Subtercola sp. Z020]PPF80329.1 MarR family transcriptional regulator [Subtercola sp. Z020]
MPDRPASPDEPAAPERPSTPVTPTPAHADAVLSALADYRSAEVEMRRRTRDSMRMGATDLQALRFLLKAQQEGRIVSGRTLADHLGMTSASVTAMLDRLTASGHVTRLPHPSDRRSLQVVATPGSDEEVRHTLGQMHRSMLSAAVGLSQQQSRAITLFLERLTAAADAS